MQVHLVFCSACDREVKVILPPRKAGEEIALSGAVCLDLDERCTGAMCPTCGTLSSEMRVQLEELRRLGKL